MKWLKVTIVADPSAEELIANILMEAGAGGVQISGNESSLAADVPCTWDVGNVTNDPNGFRVSAYFGADDPESAVLRELERRVAQLRGTNDGQKLGPLRMEHELVDDEDWATTWKEYFKPVRAADYIVIKPTWAEYNEEPGQVLVEIDPGMAFGTGNHESTRLCLTLLEKFVCPNDSVVDVGSGSGILAITAAKMGAKPVYGLDADPVAVEVTRANVRLNGVEDDVHVLQSDLFSALPEGFRADLVVCNIIADVIIRMAPLVPGVLRENGMFLCSGTIKNRSNDVAAALGAMNLRIIRIIADGEWVAMACKYKR